MGKKAFSSAYTTNFYSLFLVVLLASLSTNTSASTPPSNPCSDKLSFKPGTIPFDTSSLHCDSVWPAPHDFVLYYNQTEPGLWSFLLSTPDNDAYIGVGFSPSGAMVGSSSVVGWKMANGTGMSYQYFLGGEDSKLCYPNIGNLTIAGNKTVIVSQSSRLYLAFQLNTRMPLSKLIYAVGPKGAFPGKDLILAEHEDKISTKIKYITTSESSSTATPPTQSSTSTPPAPAPSKSHGLESALGWSSLVSILISYFWMI